jgi:hypothetical protein
MDELINIFEEDEITQTDVLEAALRYEQMGWSIIPVGRKTDNPEDLKKPLINWKQFVDRRASPDEIRTWHKRWPDMGIAVVCGEISGIVVLDLDKKHDRSAEELAAHGLYISGTACARTGGGGEHHLFNYDSRVYRNFAGDLIGLGVDVKTNGGYAILSPSIHPSGNRYKWMSRPEDGLADVPEWMIKAIEATKKEKTDWKQTLASDIGEGNRNNSMAKMCGKILHDLETSSWEEVGWPALRQYNDQHSKPPLNEDELRNVFDSISKAELASREKNETKSSAQTTTLVKLLISKPDTVLFIDQYKKAHVRFRRGNHLEIWPCDSSEIRHWLFDEYFTTTNGKVVTTQMVTSAINILMGRARASEESYELLNRTVERDGVIWYDMCDERWRAIRIDKDGWGIVEEPPILFRRHTYQKAQVEPVSGGDIREVLKFINVKDSHQQRLLLAHLVLLFIPGFPHAILYVYGAAGSAKSTLLEIQHEIIDPSDIGSMSLPRNTDELKQQLNHHSVFASFDNVSTITDEVSDLFCRAATGAGFSKRRLYTDDEDVIYRVQASIAINGINLGCHYQDLLDRSVLMELERLTDEDRQEMRTLWTRFIQEKPVLLGAILDVVSRTLNAKPSVQLTKLNRMSDYVAWGHAATIAMNEDPERYQEAFEKNVDGQNESVLNAYNEATLLIKHMEGKTRWEGTSTTLLGEFRTLNEGLLIDAKDFAKNAQALSRQLNVLKPTLEAAGYFISSGTKGKERTIVIRKVEQAEEESEQSDLLKQELPNHNYPTENTQPEK